MAKYTTFSEKYGYKIKKLKVNTRVNVKALRIHHEKTPEQWAYGTDEAFKNWVYNIMGI